MIQETGPQTGAVWDHWLCHGKTLSLPYVHAVKRSEHPNHGRGRAEPHGELVGEASTVAEALTRLDSAKPDVAVVDLFLPDGDGSGV